MTENDLVYLKPNVVIEPLFGKWYAWSHLISPATAAKNITGRHLKIMDSFILAPQLHEKAVSNPKMKGGPFMDLDSSKVDAIKTLKSQTLERQHCLVQLSEDIDVLNNMLQEKADGHTLQDLYQWVPEGLKGLVELVYDLNNQPSFRFYESLLYLSSYYRPEFQSIALWLTDDDERPFVLSTPRLESEDILHLPIPFSDSLIDRLGAMKRKPCSFGEILRQMPVPVPHEKMALLQSFFTTEAPPRYQPYQGDKVRMRYFGHACILIETKDICILLDPLVSYYGYHQQVDRFSDMDLPDKIDYVLITHNHQDHILFETLLPLRHKIKNIVVPRTTSGALQDPSLRLMFEHIGFGQVVEIGELESITFADCTITGLPFLGEHSDLNIQAKICHHVRVADFSMLFVADSCNMERRIYDYAYQVVGDIDVIFLGMECEGAPLSWLYGPLLSRKLARSKDQSRRLAGSDFERGKYFVDIFNPSEVYVYAMGQEPWLEFISSIQYSPESHPIVQSDHLLRWCQKKGVLAERLFGEKEILYHKNKKEIPEVVTREVKTP